MSAPEPRRPAPDRAELQARAEALGFAPELVHVTESPGFVLARQSVGVYGGDGFSSAYWSRKEGAWAFRQRGEVRCQAARPGRA